MLNLLRVLVVTIAAAAISYCRKIQNRSTFWYGLLSLCWILANKPDSAFSII